MATYVHSENIAHHPHDGLIKHILTMREAAAIELQHVLPAPLCAQLDWPTLKVEATSFVDPKLQPRTTDILYSVPLRQSPERRVFLYVLLEHQSTPCAAMAARFLVYTGRFYERFLREHENAKTVPLVIPVLLYQGPDGWTMPTRLSELLDVPEELAEVYRLPIELVFAVDDLSESLLGEQATEDQLNRDRWRARAEMARSLLWLVRHPQASNGERAAALGSLLEFIGQTWGPEAIEPFITYFLSAFEPDSPLRGILIDAVSAEARHMYTTIRDELLAKGEAKGRAEGEAKGRAEGEAKGEIKGLGKALLLTMSARGFVITEVQRRQVQDCRNAELLQRWLDRAAKVGRADEVFMD